MSEMGDVACDIMVQTPRCIQQLVSMATLEAVSFGPAGLAGMKVVEYQPVQFITNISSCYFSLFHFIPFSNSCKDHQDLILWYHPILSSLPHHKVSFVVFFLIFLLSVYRTCFSNITVFISRENYNF